MKLIKAYIRHRMMEEVFLGLSENGYCCMTMVECEGTGRYSDHEKEHISEKYPFADAYKVVKLEILVPAEKVSHVIKIIREKARTGYRGDGMIILSSVDEVFKIRNDETGIFSV